MKISKCPISRLALILVVLAHGTESFQSSTTPSCRSSSCSRPPVPLLFQPPRTTSTVLLRPRRNGSLRSSDATVQEPAESGGTASVTDLIFNLVKGIVGAGVLTLPSGIAAFGNAPSAVWPAVTLIAVIGSLSGYGFALIGRSCALTQTTSYRDAWSKAVSEKSSWIPAWSVTLKTMFAVLAYSMILGDTFHSLFTTVGLNFTPTQTLLGITGVFLLPLCLLKNLASLAPFSLLGSIGMVYTAIAMLIRFLGPAYKAGGSLLKDVPKAYQPAFGSTGAVGVFNPASTILIGMLSTAYMAHFNAPSFYTSLKNNTIPRYLKVVSTSFAISIGLFASMAALGFLTFGQNCAGLILNNYSNKDSLMFIARFAVAISIVFSYPLAFKGLRDGFLDLFKIKNKSDKFLNTLTVSLLAAITGLAIVTPDVSFVLSLAGSTLGNALIYIYPALMFRGAIKKLDKPTKLQKREVKIALTSALAGLGMGAVGAFKTIQSVL